jgi:hypothetical protein
MQRRTRVLAPVLALLVVAAACGGGDEGGDGGGGSASDEAPTTTVAPVPANPDGTFALVRWITASDNPAEGFVPGQATLRLWSLSPSCEGDDPCDLTLTGGGEDGSYDPPGFPAVDPMPDTELAWDDDAEAWVLEEELGAYGNCRTADNAYLDGDYTTMDETDRTELRWDEETGHLVGTKTETYTLNDAGRANPECSPDGDEVISYQVVAVPEDELDADVEDQVDLVDEYAQTREVYAVEGYDAVEVYDWRVNLEPTLGDGTCGPDECDATLTPDALISNPVLDLAFDDGELTASYEDVGPCSSAEALAAGSTETLTDEGYDVAWDLDLHTIPFDGETILIGSGEYVASPLPEAAEAFPDDCAIEETTGAYWYFVPEELLG